jgi:hypothetical protein
MFMEGKKTTVETETTGTDQITTKVDKDSIRVDSSDPS